ncbi:alpha/beta fold hydrolase [Mangrovihabitans endophyticus]|uniref:Hydrolase n=1 Tax=Mangrovihabitans endophyticus TaxID=1751298 RepID=A0A8J3C4B1_9ACTN|nr:alpha/beta hydrolase [Mangrovihabitans endophyticus]GGL07686.1 hydrolase [Mangrovihabitans endophyticus]
MRFTVSDVPNLAPGFTDVFSSRFIDVGDVSLHAVVGGDGPPLLLLPGWPKFWYSWRLVMPALAEHFTVVAADMRGMGASAKPATGYDAANLADDMASVMTGLGHDRFDLAGHDLGMMVAYAVAARHRGRVTRLAVAEAILPGLSPSPPLMMDPAMNEFLWHFAFNRLHDINERMVAGREEIYFGHQFASKAGRPDAIPQYAVDLYVEALRDPAALHASFQFYRAEESVAQVVGWHHDGQLDMPVLAIGGELSYGTAIEEVMRLVAKDVTGVVIPGVAHYVPEEAPEAVARELLGFFRR